MGAEDRIDGEAEFARIQGMPRNEGRDARPRERVRADGRSRLSYLDERRLESKSNEVLSAWL